MPEVSRVAKNGIPVAANLGHAAIGVVVIPRSHSLGAIRQFPDRSEVIPRVKKQRSIRIYKTLPIEPLDDGVAIRAAFFYDLRLYPEVLLIRRRREIPLGVFVLFDDLDPAPEPVVPKLAAMPSGLNDHGNESIFRIWMVRRTSPHARPKPAPRLALLIIEFPAARKTP